LWIWNDTSAREVTKPIPFTIASKEKTHLDTSLIGEVKDMYSEKCNTLMKEIKKSHKWEKSCASGLENLILLKCTWYPKQATDSMQFLSKL
jgi:hypothetical protein